MGQIVDVNGAAMVSKNAVTDLQRALGAELAARRTARRMTQAHLARLVHVHRTTVAHIEAGDHNAAASFWELADNALVASGALVDGYLRLQKVIATHQCGKIEAVVESRRRVADQHWSQASFVPDRSHVLSDLATFLDASIAESTDLTTETETTNVGSASLEQLQTDVKDLASKQLHASASRTAADVILARRRVLRFLRGTQTPLQEMDLYFLAGQLSGLLSHTCKDLGKYEDAATHARTARACGRAIKHDGLMAWACGLQAISAYWSGRPGRAVEFADSGLRYMTAGTTASWLHGVRARAFGHLHNSESLRDALLQAWAARDPNVENDLCDLLDGASGFSEEKLCYYSTNALAWAGEAHGAMSEGLRALEMYDATEPLRRSASAAATVRIDMSITMLGQRKLPEAVAILRPALATDPVHCNAGFRQQLRRVRRELDEPRHQSPLTRDVTAEIDALLATEAANTEQSATSGSGAL